MTTLRQINANRINCLNSKGPTSPSGKSISRANALKHGLAGEGIVLPDEERAEAQERAAQWNSSLKPFTAFDVWLVDVVATEAVRVERCRILEANVREEEARRAGESWDEDRTLAAAKLATRLSAKPEVVALELATTTQGVDVLIEHWRALGSVLPHNIWSDAERSLALDLLGIPRALRDAETPIEAASLSPGGVAGLVAQRIEKLLALKPVLDARDGREQASAMLGLGPSSADLNRLRRYEASCLRRLKWAYTRLKSPAPSPCSSDSTSYFSQPAYSAPSPSAPPLLVSGRLVDALDESFDDEILPISVGSSVLPSFSPQTQAPVVYSHCQSG